MSTSAPVRHGRGSRAAAKRVDVDARRRDPMRAGSAPSSSSAAAGALRRGQEQVGRSEHAAPVAAGAHVAVGVARTGSVSHTVSTSLKPSALLEPRGLRGEPVAELRGVDDVRAPQPRLQPQVALADRALGAGAAGRARAARAPTRSRGRVDRHAAQARRASCRLPGGTRTATRVGRRPGAPRPAAPTG